MGIPLQTFQQMQAEGIADVDDLGEFDKDGLANLADNLRRPPGRIPDPNGGGATIPTPAFVFGAKSQKRLKVACDLVRYYETVGRELTAANIRWFNVMKNFEIQWKALKERQDGDDTPDVPKVSKSLPIMKWTEAFQDFLRQVIGVRTIPLCYVTREMDVVPAAAPQLANGQPHSTEHGSVEEELIARASHDHALFQTDNAKVYFYVEEATRTTAIAASIKPYQRTKDGRGAWKALIAQYAGRDKWEAEIQRQEQLLHTRKWKGQSNFTLEGFVSQHRNAFVSMTACAEHVQYQLPNEHSRVGFFLEGIECSDAGLQAAMASIRTDIGPTGMRNDFERAVAHILPYDPVAKKRANAKRSSALISGVDGDVMADVSSVTKPSIGKTGVHFRYYKGPEFAKLSKEQKKELLEWRKSKPSNANEKASGNKHPETEYSKEQISAMVAEQVDSVIKKIADEAKKEKSKDDNSSALLAAIQASLSEKSDEADSKKTVTLKSILKNAKK